MILRARQHVVRFPRPAQVMGILNVTPDSFHDGGRHADPARAVEHGLRLEAEGADWIDVGGESTRPQAEPVPEAEELRRVIPVIEGLVARARVPISIDTMKPAVARAAVAAGASLINDVAASRTEGEMWRVVAETGAAYVVMHMQGTPRTMQMAPAYQDVVGEVDAFFGERLAALARAGVAAEQVVLDVGIGFGKTVEHNLQLLAHIGGFTRWQRPLLLGLSRKSFLPRVTGDAPEADRLAGSLAGACWGVAQGVSMVRVHDVAATRQALRLTEALQSQNNR